jgi:hypothetical protein
MNGEQPLGGPAPAGPRSPLLERITAVVLIAVLGALGWMLLAAENPGRLRFAPVEVEVVVVVALLAAALVLVSVVALLHTRGGTEKDESHGTKSG